MCFIDAYQQVLDCRVFTKSVKEGVWKEGIDKGKCLGRESSVLFL